MNLTLDAEKPVLLLGESGRGKTTLMRLLLGFIKPESGEIKGIDKNTRIAVMFQENRLFPHMSVYKNLKLIKKDLSRENAESLLGELNLKAEVLDRLPGELSGGMRRRIALARTLIFPADMLLMDEPFQGLDEDNRKLALAAVKKYSHGRPLLLISHEPEDGPALGARTVRLEDISEKGSAENE